jgi:hypothetical protein
MPPQPIHFHGPPAGNVNGNYANIDSSNYPGGFNSLSLANFQYGLRGAANNVAAANASKVGGRTVRRKKNISDKYRMVKKSTVHRFRSLKKRLTKNYKIGKNKLKSKFRSFRKRMSKYFSRKQRGGSGGYTQFGSNIANTPTYSTGGILSAANLGQANPVPHQVISSCANCVDNYHHLSNKGYQN